MQFDILGENFQKDMILFSKNGIILDTSVIKIFIDGLIGVRLSKKNEVEFPDYKKLIQ
jgi:hypothetical protein